MRCLRKAGPAHSRFRPRVLAAALAAGCLLAGLCSCVPGKAAAAAEPAASWYQLHAGGFQRLERPGAGLAIAFRPWTVQGRVADMAFMTGALYCGINGSGIAAVTLGPDGTPAFTYHLDSLIFAHRTITTLIPRPGALTVHLYYNALLNDAPQQDLTLTGISLVSFLPAKADFAFLVPPFQRKNPEYEAVGFAPITENRFAFEWKFTDPGETRFAYTRFDADTLAEAKETREGYLGALGVPSIGGNAVPAELGAFFALCKGALAPTPTGTSLQFVLRSHTGAVRRVFRSAAESDAAVVIPVFDAGSARLALLPGGRVLSAPAGAGGSPRTVNLPALPGGFRYGDIVKSGDWLVVTWEESRFTDVGRAGIVLVRFPG